MPHIERSRGILFYRCLSVRLSAQTEHENLTFSHYSKTNLLTRLIFGMKACLINMHLLVPRSRSCAKVKVKYKGYIFQKIVVLGAFMFHKHILLFWCLQMLSIWTSLKIFRLVRSEALYLYKYTQQMILCFQGSDQTPSKMTNGTSNTAPIAPAGSVLVPQRIHSITQKYFTSTNYLVQAHELWDQAESSISGEVKGKNHSRHSIIGIFLAQVVYGAWENMVGCMIPKQDQFLSKD